jgi:hypothetical protein
MSDPAYQNFVLLHDKWIKVLVDRFGIGLYHGYVSLYPTGLNFTMYEVTHVPNQIEARSTIQVGTRVYICVCVVDLDLRTVRMVTEKSGELMNGVIPVGVKRCTCETQGDSSPIVEHSDLLRSIYMYWVDTSLVLTHYFPAVA